MAQVCPRYLARTPLSYIFCTGEADQVSLSATLYKNAALLSYAVTSAKRSVPVTQNPNIPPSPDRVAEGAAGQPPSLSRE